MRSRTTRSMRSRPMRSWFWISSPTVLTRRLPRWSMSSSPSMPLLIWIMRRSTATRSSLVRVRCAQRDVQLEAPVELVAADLAQVVAPGRKDQVLHEAPGIVQRRRIARAQLLIELQQRAVDALGRIRRVRGAGWVALQRRGDVGMLGIVVDFGEELEDRFVGAKADGAQQHGDRQLALAVNLHRDDVALRWSRTPARRPGWGSAWRSTRRRSVARSSSTVK